MRIVQAETVDDWGDVERLIRAYVEGLPFVLDFQDIDRELAERRVEYGPPTGAALLLEDDEGARVGVVGVRRFEGADAELKRMYLAPAARGAGQGRALAAAAVGIARSLGYERLLLDTISSMTSAIAIYESLGFLAIEPYRHNPLEAAQFFGLDLRAGT